MHSQRNPRAQRAVLGFVLYEHPAPLTFAEIEREVGDDTAQAVSELVAVGLLRRDGDAVRPTSAAINFDALEQS